MFNLDPLTSYSSAESNVVYVCVCVAIQFILDVRFVSVCMYVCMVITYSRVWINRVRLPILLVVS